MGRKKSPVTHNKSINRHRPASSSSSSASSLLGDVSPSSLRGLAAIKQEPTAMETESSSDSLQLPSPSIRSLHTVLPIGGGVRDRRPKNRRKRWSSGDGASARRRDQADDYNDEDRQEEEQEEQEEMVTISVAELEKWQQRVIFHVEDHFTNEQLKRIAEFGRVHGTIMQEARQYVSSMEVQLKKQFEEERASLRAQAEEFVAKTAVENESLRQQVEDLKQQVEGLKMQIDTLKLDLDALKVEKAQNAWQQDAERQGNREHPQPTHSPPKNQTKVQPEDDEVDGNVETHPANSDHLANGYEPGGQGSSHPPLAAKQIAAGPIDPCCAADAPTPNGIQSNANVVVECGLPVTKSSEPPAELRVARVTGTT